MNITFCVSSIPNQRMVSGINAATGRFRPNSASGAPVASITRHEPAAIPSGTPIRIARPKPSSTRFSVAAMLCTSARSLSRLAKLAEHFDGTGQHDGRHDPRFRGADGDDPPYQGEQRHSARTEQIAHGAGGGDAKREQPAFRHYFAAAGASAG